MHMSESKGYQRESHCREKGSVTKTGSESRIASRFEACMIQVLCKEMSYSFDSNYRGRHVIEELISGERIEFRDQGMPRIEPVLNGFNGSFYKEGIKIEPRWRLLILFQLEWFWISLKLKEGQRVRRINKSGGFLSVAKTLDGSEGLIWLR
ncbi:unnamed protein product [Cochlearia groenlandica]